MKAMTRSAGGARSSRIFSKSSITRPGRHFGGGWHHRGVWHDGHDDDGVCHDDGRVCYDGLGVCHDDGGCTVDTNILKDWSCNVACTDN